MVWGKRGDRLGCKEKLGEARKSIWSQCESLHLLVLMLSFRKVTVRPERKEKSCTGGWPHPLIICSCFLSNSHYFLCNFPPWGNPLFLPKVNLFNLNSNFHNLCESFCTVCSLRLVFKLRRYLLLLFFQPISLIGIVWQYFVSKWIEKLEKKNYVNIKC